MQELSEGAYNFSKHCLQVIDNPQAFEIKIEFVDRKNTNLRAGFIRQLDFSSCATAGVSTSNGKGNSTYVRVI
jgi:hypothetical protein